MEENARVPPPPSTSGASTMLLLLHNWAKFKKPAKKRFKKIVKLSDHTCACNDLTNFECEATGYGIYVTAENCMKKLVKQLWASLFSVGSSFLETLCGGGGADTASQAIDASRLP